MPQGAMFGMKGFLSLINDLQPSLPLFKYVDDSTTLDIIRKKDPDNNSMQKAIDFISHWTKTNDMQINAKKTHELLMSFQKHLPNPSPNQIDGQSIDRVCSAKLVGKHIQDDLKWDVHVQEMLKKARIKLHFLIQLKKSRVPYNHAISFYKSVIVPQLEYAYPAWATSITKEQSNDIERIQKRALKIVFPDLDYNQALEKANLKTLSQRRLELQKESNILHTILPKVKDSNYSLISNLKYTLPKVKTNRFKSSFIPYCLYNFQ